MTPITTWGRTFAVAPTPNINRDEQYLLMAAEDNTRIVINGNFFEDVRVVWERYVLNRYSMYAQVSRTMASVRRFEYLSGVTRTRTCTLYMYAISTVYVTYSHFLSNSSRSSCPVTVCAVRLVDERILRHLRPS